MTKAKTWMSCLMVALCVGSASAKERRISVEEYRDKMKAGWLGQMIGVGWGLPTEFQYRNAIIPEDKTPAWKPEMINQYINDDLFVEMSFIKSLETYGVDVSSRQAGIDYANSQFGVVHANHYGRDALRSGIAPPDSGHPQFNRSGVDHVHSDDIDYQIESDYSGLIAPGMPNVSIVLGEKFGVLMNYGDGVYAGQFMGAMIAEAFFETDMEKVVVAGLKAIPEGSQYHKCISDVLKWYRANPNPDDWQKTWQVLEDKYGKDACANDGARCDSPGIDVKINGAYAVMGLLYGKGDIAETCKISMRCGLDSDCNPSSAVGILATSLGTAALKEYTTALDREARYATTEYTFDKLLNVCEKLAREFVVDQGGRIKTPFFGKETFVIPVKKPVPSKLVQSYDPEPPTGNRFTKEELAQMAYFSLAPAFEKIHPGNPWGLTTRSCGSKKNPGFREEYNGRENVIASIPIEGSRNFNFNVRRNLQGPKKYKLVLEVGHEPGHDWTLIVARVHAGVHDRVLTEKINDETAPDGWKTFEIDFPEQHWMALQITSWYDEEDKAPAYWSKMEFVEVAE
jgi:hypothetical protein